MKKTFIFLLLLTLVLSSCAKDNTVIDDNYKDKDGTSGKKRINVAILTSHSGIDDGSFNQNIYEGVLGFLDEYKNATVCNIQVSKTSKEAIFESLIKVIKDYDVFILSGFQFSELSEIAIDNQDKKFIIVDGKVDEDDGKILSNVLYLNFKEQESGFLAGIVAANETKTGKVAIVNGIAYPSNVNYQYGFMAGVNYSNHNFATDVDIVEIESLSGTDINDNNVGGNYVGSFNDDSSAKFVAEELIAESVDIIMVATGASGAGVFSAVKESEEDIFVIASDVDQYDYGFVDGDNIVKTSALKSMDVSVKRALLSIADGSFKGGTKLLGLESKSTGIVLENGRNQLSEETIKRVKECLDKIKSGEIIPPSNFSESTVNDFKGLK